MGQKGGSVKRLFLTQIKLCVEIFKTFYFRFGTVNYRRNQATVQLKLKTVVRVSGRRAQHKDWFPEEEEELGA